LAFGGVSELTLYLPGALSGLSTAWLVFGFAKSYFGARAAFLGAIATMLTPAGFKLFGLARTDGVFAFTVTLTALLAFRAWVLGKGWTWVWVAAAASTLTKGPLGPVLAGLGLLASRWENKSGNPFPVRGSHLAGIALFLGLVGTWFLLAYSQLGEALTSKMLSEELVGHAVSADRKQFPGALFYQPPLTPRAGCALSCLLITGCGVFGATRAPIVQPAPSNVSCSGGSWAG
jgi:4-amino-4-deoxy-L-arabinose transferase-like glycosyltransferase